ncbi:MAG: hypothetical protein DRR19_08560 [Candidatus Parabeggiatoa sp. nov. 1]|nr:MAG: hypothetical protein DRR19_08560 [Gammaproteobacteria bacterium]
MDERIENRILSVGEVFASENSRLKSKNYRYEISSMPKFLVPKKLMREISSWYWFPPNVSPKRIPRNQLGNSQVSPPPNIE